MKFLTNYKRQRKEGKIDKVVKEFIDANDKYLMFLDCKPFDDGRDIQQIAQVVVSKYYKNLPLEDFKAITAMQFKKREIVYYTLNHDILLDENRDRWKDAQSKLRGFRCELLVVCIPAFVTNDDYTFRYALKRFVDELCISVVARKTIIIYQSVEMDDYHVEF